MYESNEHAWHTVTALTFRLNWYKTIFSQIDFVGTSYWKSCCTVLCAANGSAQATIPNGIAVSDGWEPCWVMSFTKLSGATHSVDIFWFFLSCSFLIPQHFGCLQLWKWVKNDIIKLFKCLNRQKKLSSALIKTCISICIAGNLFSRDLRYQLSVACRRISIENKCTSTKLSVWLFLYG